MAPKGFTGTSLDGPDLWLPLGTYSLVEHAHEERPDSPIWRLIWDYPHIELIGRLKPGLDRTTAEARIQAMLPRLKDLDHRWKADSKLYLAGLRQVRRGEEDERDKKQSRLVSVILMGISSVILLIACLNLAHMLSVQGVQRQREIAIRMAIGGGRLRIVQQLLIESLLLTLLGTVLAIVPVWVGIRFFNAWLMIGNLRFQIPTSLDIRILGATLGFCLLATVLSGLMPALRLAKRDVISDLKEAGAGLLRTS